MEPLGLTIYLSYLEKRICFHSPITTLKQLKSIFLDNFPVTPDELDTGKFIFKDNLDFEEFSIFSNFPKIAKKIEASHFSEITFFSKEPEYFFDEAAFNSLAAPTFGSAYKSRKSTFDNNSPYICSLCNFPLLLLYRCVYCDNLILCSDCDDKHAHPSLQINVTHNNPFENLAFFKKFIETKAQECKRNNLVSMPSCMPSRKKEETKLEVSSYLTKFTVLPFQPFDFRFTVKNVDKHDLPENTRIIVVNGRDMQLPSVTIEKRLERQEKIEVEINSFALNKGRFNLKILICNMATTVVSNEMIITVVVSDLIEFSAKDKVSKLDEKKKNAIRKILTTTKRKMSIDEIYENLKANNWECD